MAQSYFTGEVEPHGSDWTIGSVAAQEHILFVHAHPDDETITTGGTIATLIDAGASVTLLTCTRGELGEVVPAELQYLAGDALGAHRETELATAMRALGLNDHRFAGSIDACADGTAPHRFRDSGMQWGPEGAEPLSTISPRPDSGSSAVPLTEADLDLLILDVCAVIEDVKPTAIISYDSDGGYGHPDHVRTHEATSIAALVTGVPFYAIVPAGEERARDIRVDVSEVLDRKKQALAAHRTQLTLVGDTIVHSGGQVEQIRDVEVFRHLVEPGDRQLDWQRLGIFTKIATCVLVFVVGGVIGFVGTANHQLAFAAGSLLLVAGYLTGLRLLFRTRTAALFAALGVLLAVATLSLESPGGSVLVQANVVGYVWTYGAPVIALIVLAWPSLGSRVGDTMEKLAEPEKVVDAS